MNTQLAYVTINGRKIVARAFVLEALLKAHEDIKAAGIGYGGQLGFVLSNERTGSWRSEVLQKELKDAGASKTMYSNHRMGTAIDCAADWGYINKIKPFMNKYGLVNDLAYVDKAWTKADDTKDAETPIPWDGGHWNWKSNSEASKYPIINKLPIEIRELSMDQYDGEIIFEAEKSGAFAGVYRGEKHPISSERAGFAAIHPLLGGKKAVSVTLAVWDSIPTGDAF